MIKMPEALLYYTADEVAECIGPGTIFESRNEAAFAAVAHHLKNQEENRGETCEPG